MRTSLVLALAATIGCGSFTQQSIAQSNLLSPQDLVRQVSVSGVGEAKVEADMARVHLSAQAQSPTSAEAKDIVDQRVNEVIRILENVGLEEDDLTAGQISISPRYNYRNNTQEFIGYFASRSIQVEIPDLDLLNTFLDAALEQEIDGINQIEYRTSKEEEAMALARELAIQDSKDKASFLAEAYDVDLGSVISINYQSSNSTPVLYQEAGVSLMRASADSAGQYIPDQLSFSDRISVTFQLEAD